MSPSLGGWDTPTRDVETEINFPTVHWVGFHQYHVGQRPVSLPVSPLVCKVYPEEFLEPQTTYFSAGKERWTLRQLCPQTSPTPVPPSKHLPLLLLLCGSPGHPEGSRVWVGREENRTDVTSISLGDEKKKKKGYSSLTEDSEG